MICNLFQFKRKPSNNLVNVVYDANRHRASNRSRKEINWLLSQKKDVDNYYLRFSGLSKYLLNNDGSTYLGWNKLLGTYQFNVMIPRQSFGMHANSHRIVWRFNPKTQGFDVATYSYRAGVRSWEIVGENIKEGQIFTVRDFKLMYGCNANAYFGGIYTPVNDVVIEVW